MIGYSRSDSSDSTRLLLDNLLITLGKSETIANSRFCSRGREGEGLENHSLLIGEPLSLL